MCSMWGIVMFYTAIHPVHMAPYTLHHDFKVWEWNLLGTSFLHNEACCSSDEGRAIVHLGWRLGWLPWSQQLRQQWAAAETSQTWRVCWAFHCVCLCWTLPFGSYWLIWIGTNFLLFHYPRYCLSAIYYQSLLVLLSFLWILKCDVIHSVRDLKIRLLILGWVYKRGWILFRFVRIFLIRLWLFLLDRCTYGGTIV